MIGSGLKKLANENGMQVGGGVAYGNLRGFAATLSEGSGYKQIVVTTKFTDVEKLNQLQALINRRDISRELRVKNLSFAPNGVSIVFLDNPGTMNKIKEFIDWFFPLLAEHGATAADICTECGTQVIGGKWKLIDGVAFYMHDSCAQKVVRDIDADHARKHEEDTGSYLKGTIGALLGAALGAVLWGIVLNMGYVASIVGLVIGWLAEKGYNLLHGKQGKAKVAILAVAVIFGVLLGTFGADIFTLATMVADGSLPGLTYGDIPVLLILMLTEDSVYAGAVVKNILMGLLFAGLGVFMLLRNTSKAVSKTKVVDLP